MSQWEYQYYPAWKSASQPLWTSASLPVTWGWPNPSIVGPRFSHHLGFFLLFFRKKACKYFEQGKGTCPFGSKCLYRHAYPDGRLAEPEKPRKQLSSEGTVRVRTLPSLVRHTYCGHFQILLLSFSLIGQPEIDKRKISYSASILSFLVTRHIFWLFLQFFNSVRLWDFIENRESQHVPNTEDVDMTELGDLFMHLSGVESSEPWR